MASKIKDVAIKILNGLKKRLDNGEITGSLKIDKYDYDYNLDSKLVTFYVIFDDEKYYTGFAYDKDEVYKLGADIKKMNDDLDVVASQIQTLIERMLQEEEKEVGDNNGL